MADYPSLPHFSTSYSLPGHVMLTVPNIGSVPVYQGRIRSVKELKVTFEGKTEFCDDAGKSHERLQSATN